MGVLSRRRRAFVGPIAVGCIAGFLCATAFFFGVLHTWNERMTDRFFLPERDASAVIIVGIDDASLQQIGRWPWPRSVHADLINRLSAAGARVIGYDVSFLEPSDAENDRALVDALRLSGRVVLPVELDMQMTVDGPAYTPNLVLAPLPEIGAVALATGHGNLLPDADGIVRRAALLVPQNGQFAPAEEGMIPSFAFQVASFAGYADQLRSAPVQQGQTRIFFAAPPRSGFRSLSAVDVLRGTADMSIVQGAIVFVGATAPDLHDAQLVPTSYGTLMPGVEIHASIVDTIAHGRWLVPVPPLWMGALIFALGLLMGIGVALLGGRWSIVMLVLVWMTTVLAAFIAFDRGWIADILWPSIALFLAFTSATFERRLHTDRERRALKMAFSRYVSPKIVEAIVRHPERLKLGGERKRMTVLFSDIRGFTSMSEKLSPEALVEVLNVYLGRMTQIVFQEQGVLDKYIGDAVMAFWNGPLNQERHAQLAASTALEMQHALREMNAAKRFGDQEIHIGIGINTGEMVVGNIGGDAKFDYTVIGDNVNLASRLEGLTKEYGVAILCTESTAKDIASLCLCRRLDKVAVKGKKESVVIYEIVTRYEHATDAERELVRRYETALEAYMQRDFASAIRQCDSLLVTSPMDGATQLLRRRAEHLLNHPPAPDWDGAWIFTTK